VTDNEKPPSDPFDRVKAAAGSPNPPAAGKSKAKRDLGDWVSPIPRDAPAALTSHHAHGKPSAVWTYTDAAGGALFHVARFDAPDGSKVVLPLTLWRQAERLRWAWNAPPEPRPLYGLPALAERPGAPVLAVEGEKTAEAARARFPAFAVVTWQGGSKAASKAAWAALAGREVVIFPDADEPGRKAAQDVARRASAAGVATVAVVDVPAALPDGWDLADDWPAGFGVAEATAAIDAARERASPAGVEWPWGFRMEADGLFYDQPVKDGGIVPQRLSAPFEVLAEARAGGGDGWAVVVRFKDRDGREKTVPISRSRLASGGAEVRAELADQGLIVSPARGKSDKFVIALAEVQCARRMTLVTATGWADDRFQRFVIPGRPIGAVGGEAVLFMGEPSALHYRQAGTLERWRQDVAAKAEGNALLTFALSLAFAGPLLRLLDLEGGGVHFRGSSSCGKTTLAFAAGSVWGGGGPLGFGHTWRSTANALEMLAAGHDDGLVVLDELSLISTDEAGTAAYALAAGQSKGRSQTTGALRRRAEWRVTILSTGEISLADHIRAGRKGERPMAGQELRLLDIDANGGQHMGVWEALHGAEGPAALSDRIKAACARHYGHAGPAFVERLIADTPAAQATAKSLIAAFLTVAREEGDSGQAERAAVRFALFAAAGELASAFGVVPWPGGAASAAALTLYRRWARAFGRSAPREEREILTRLRAAIQSERAMFSPLGDDDTTEASLPSAMGRDGEARGLRTYGFRWVRGPEVCYCFHNAGWAEITKGFNPVEAARMVFEAGYLVTDGDPKRLKKSIKIKGEKQNFYCIKSDILEADLGD